MKSFYKKYVLLIAVLLFSISCKRNKLSFELIEFDPIINLGKSGDTLISLRTDLDDAVLNGIVIPSAKQTKSGFFVFKFKVKNTGEKPQRLFYKIYYQNESYKFPDEHLFSYENFYGSWEETNFKIKVTPPLIPGEEYEGLDSFRIVGNPRNEEKFMGADMRKFRLTDSLIQTKINAIRSDANWMASVEHKATKGKIKVEDQIYLDALWAVSFDLQNRKESNNRWKRNPRMGEYKFYLLVTNSDRIYKIPKGNIDLAMHDSNDVFSNPFKYFTSAKVKADANLAFMESPKKIKVNASINLRKGIYFDRLKARSSTYSSQYHNETCNIDTLLYQTAQVEQYFHDINRDFPLRNVPEIKDVVGENMSRDEYDQLTKKYANYNKTINTYVNSSDCPCKTVSLDSASGHITMINPGNKDSTLKKEHVGIRSRIGFTYGKFRAKVKFPPLVSKNNVWNGITNAFWLLVQEGDAGWNKRRICRHKQGYLEKSLPDDISAMWQSKPQITYSEIDFEILKESQYWPKSSYKDESYFKEDSPATNNNIMVTCTNWDMACQEPKYFMQGFRSFTYGEQTYEWHRWNDWYKAITTKVPAPNDELFNSAYYYFEIEWQPEKIVWKIGPEKNKLKVIAEIQSDGSSIPNNQMNILFTQEWHNQEWWPTAPFKQNFVPFPKEDIIGKIMEIEIE